VTTVVGSADRNRTPAPGVDSDGDFALFERHLDALYRSALRLTRKPEDAEDLVQETYLRAFRYRKRFTPGTNEKAWLFTIMTNVFRNKLRQRPPIQESIDEPANDAYIYHQLEREGLPLHLMSPEELIVERGFGKEVRRALEELPLPMRMVVILVDVEDFSYKEVAKILHVKIGTVMSRLHRGRRSLQKKLWEYSGRRPQTAAMGGGVS
jgi:RNA polymerase sigma-70 factor, ECF subfamily